MVNVRFKISIEFGQAPVDQPPWLSIGPFGGVRLAGSRLVTTDGDVIATRDSATDAWEVQVEDAPRPNLFDTVTVVEAGNSVANLRDLVDAYVAPLYLAAEIRSEIDSEIRPLLLQVSEEEAESILNGLDAWRLRRYVRPLEDTWPEEVRRKVVDEVLSAAQWLDEFRDSDLLITARRAMELHDTIEDMVDAGGDQARQRSLEAAAAAAYAVGCAELRRRPRSVEMHRAAVIAADYAAAVSGARVRLVRDELDELKKRLTKVVERRRDAFKRARAAGQRGRRVR